MQRLFTGVQAISAWDCLYFLFSSFVVLTTTKEWCKLNCVFWDLLSCLIWSLLSSFFNLRSRLEEAETLGKAGAWAPALWICTLGSEQLRRLHLHIRVILYKDSSPETQQWLTTLPHRTSCFRVFILAAGHLCTPNTPNLHSWRLPCINDTLWF